MKINVGAGRNPIEGYINIDRATGGEAFPLSQDGIAFDSCIADEIRASHVLEHFSHRETLDVLKEWIRVLKPSGLLKIAVPDFDQIIALKVKGDPLWDKYLMGGHTDNNDMHGATFTRDGLKDLMREAGCIVQYSDMYWNDKLDYCSDHPSGVSLNIQGFKRENIVDVPKPILAKQRKICALMSAPRVGFTNTHGMIETIFAAYRIKVTTYFGAFWEQGIQNCIQKAIEQGYDDVITIDFDSIFDAKQFERMLSHWIAHPEVDALAALQPKRGDGRAMLTPMGADVNYRGTHEAHTEHTQNGMQVQTAHFGFTFLRLDKVAKMPKPWFWNQPAPLELPKEICNEFDRFVSDSQTEKFMKLFDKHFGVRFLAPKVKSEDSGKWKSGGAVDADIYFWMKWNAAGNNLFVLTDVCLGHLEVLVAQHNPETGYAMHRYSGEWNENPLGGKKVEVQCKEHPAFNKPNLAYEINEKNTFDDAHLFVDDKYPQSFIQHSKTVLGEPSTDLSGSIYRNCQNVSMKSFKKGRRRIHITFAGKRYDETVKCIVDNSTQLGSDAVIVYDDAWLIENHPEFIEARRDIFIQNAEKFQDYEIAEYDDIRFTRGFGWFCWKPFIIQHALENFCEDGDIILFSDADTFPIADLTPFYDHADKHGCMLFAAAHLRQQHWCKRDTMREMLMDEDLWRDKQAGNARYMAFKKGATICERNPNITSEVFLNEWLDLASQKKLTTFELSENEYAELKPGSNGKALGQHRCEQAILTNLAHWYGIPLHRPPCQDGAGYLK